MSKPIPRYYYQDALAALGDVLHNFDILSGDVVGASHNTWQDYAKYTARNLRRLANMLDAAAAGHVLHGPAVFPSAEEALNPDPTANKGG